MRWCYSVARCSADFSIVAGRSRQEVASGRPPTLGSVAADEQADKRANNDEDESEEEDEDEEEQGDTFCIDGGASSQPGVGAGDELTGYLHLGTQVDGNIAWRKLYV